MEELGKCIQEEKARRETAVNDLLDEFRKAVDAHLENCRDDDYGTLKDLLNDIPANVEVADFMLSLRICDGVIRTGKGE